jgi:hypothetical protein
MSEDCKKIVKDALINGNKIQYPLSVYVPYRGVELLDFMYEFIHDNSDMDMTFKRDNNQGYWCLKNRKDIDG